MPLISNLRKINFVPIDSGGRRLTGTPAALMIVLTIAFSIYVFSINSWLLLDLMRRSGVFAALLLAMTFLLYPAGPWSPKDRPSIFDYAFSILGAAGGLYIWATYLSFVERNLELTTMDIVMGTITLVLALEAGRRCLGIWMSGLALIFIAYALFGQMMPYPFGHFGVKPERLLIRMYMVDEGIFGSLLQVAQTYIGLFVLFGAFLTVIGASEALTNIGLALSGRYTGGPAKVAAIASGLTGMISGTASANVATTGTLTIPMMKRVGFAAHFAGAVEAIASTGGLIMPPIMGAAAFLVAEFVGIPYAVVVIGAVIPAVLYYGSLLLVIHIRALKYGIAGVPKEEIPSLRKVLVQRGHLLIPIVILIWMLLSGRTPTWAAMVAIVTALAVSFLRKETRLTLTSFFRGLIDGAAAALPVSIACLVAGIIVGVVTLTGVAQVFTGYIEMLSGGSLLLALFLTAIASILLSCALPATAVYIVVAVTIAPALIQMGAMPLAAHFFVFWFGVLSNITPPVAIACFTAAGIAGASPTKVAFTSLRMAFPAFIIPFVVVLHPDLLLIDWSVFGLLRTIVLTVAGIAAYVAATEGWLIRPLSMPLRLVFGLVAILCLVIVEPTSGYVGFAIGAAATAFLLLRRPAASPVA